MTPQPVTARSGKPLQGRICVPGDKSISHRALILSALSAGQSRVSGLLESEDVLATAEALRRLGAVINRDEDGIWHVLGRGVGGLSQPEAELDFGNSGTGARLMMGVIAGHDISARLTGDHSLNSRPMGRVLGPLQMMGAAVEPENSEKLPFTLIGADMPIPMSYEVPVPSAQVKSAILLAGLNTAGRTRVIEARRTRDHTERMMAIYGADIKVMQLPGGGRQIDLVGQAELSAQDITVPGDPSSAAFPAVAALITPGSDIILENVMINPDRHGLFVTLEEMGANIASLNPRRQSGEQIVDLKVRFSDLRGIAVPPERAPSMIDEYPVLAVAAAFAQGDTLLQGLSELRVKESDRLAAITDGLAANGVSFELSGDDLMIKGQGQAGSGGVRGGGCVLTHMDHRIAMSFLIMGLASAQPVMIDDGAMIATSFPGFTSLMQGLGADISMTQGELSC